MSRTLGLCGSRLLLGGQVIRYLAVLRQNVRQRKLSIRPQNVSLTDWWWQLKLVMGAVLDLVVEL